MTLFYANSTTNGSALTNTKPSSTITSTASATATSTVSKEDAQNIANSEAQSLANQVAQNDANIISQTLNISTAGIKGAYSYLNLYEAIRCDVNPYTESGLYGIMFPVYISSVSKPNSGTCVISFEKQIYPVNSLDPNQTPPDKNNPYPNSTVKAFYNFLNAGEQPEEADNSHAEPHHEEDQGTGRYLSKKQQSSDFKTNHLIDRMGLKFPKNG
jgi:hypothetical protein